MSHGAGGAAHPAINVLVVDDQRLVREALADCVNRRTDMHVVGEAGSISDLAATVGADPDVAIVDDSLPDGTGIDACRQIRARWPSTRILMLSDGTDDEVILATLQAGAEGYLGMSEGLATVVRAVQDISAGRPIIAPALLGQIALNLGAPPPLHDGRPTPARWQLTARELSVLRLLANGHGTRQIASELGVAEGTVRRHAEAIRRKLGVHSRLEAVSEALRCHIVELLPS